MASPPLSHRLSGTSGGTTNAPTVDDDLPTDTALPLPLSASMMLSTLPNDASAALSRAQDQVSATEGVAGKVKIRLHALPRAPQLAQKVFKCNASNRFESVVVFLRKRLGLKHDEGVVCYVNSVFAPGLDEGVGGLWKCFKQGSGQDEVLVVAYSLTPAFG